MPAPRITHVELNAPHPLTIIMNRWDNFLEEYALRLTRSVNDISEQDVLPASPSSSSSEGEDVAESFDGQVIEEVEVVASRVLFSAQTNNDWIGPNVFTHQRAYVLVICTTNPLAPYEYIGVASIGEVDDDENNQDSFIDQQNLILTKLLALSARYNRLYVEAVYAIPYDNFSILLSHNCILFSEHQRPVIEPSWEVVSLSVAAAGGFLWMDLDAVLENVLYIMTGIAIAGFIVQCTLELLRYYWNHSTPPDRFDALYIAVSAGVLGVKLFGGAGAWITALDLVLHHSVIIQCFAVSLAGGLATTLMSMLFLAAKNQGVMANADYFREISKGERRALNLYLNQQQDIVATGQPCFDTQGSSYFSWLREHILLFLSAASADGIWRVVDVNTTALTQSTVGNVERALLNCLAIGFAFWLPTRGDQLLNSFELYPRVLAAPAMQLHGLFSSPRPLADPRLAASSEAYISVAFDEENFHVESPEELRSLASENPSFTSESLSIN